MITRISIGQALERTNAFWIDARSPKEYEDDHIGNAVNLPLLNDEERHEVGIIYKQISQEKAIEKGMEYYAPKVPTIFNTVKEHYTKDIIIYCARGGMRSGIIASLLDSVGFKVYQVEDGYKGFRNYMVGRIKDCPLPQKVYVLWGLTCTGKTALLGELDNALDLEGLAQHRGSLMGALGLQPHSQKKFENLLLKRLDELKGQKSIVVEGESRRIGNVIIPPFLWKAMMQGENILLTRTVEERAEAMVKEYFREEHINEIQAIVSSFRRVISNRQKEEIIKNIKQQKYQDAARSILLHYYDPLYKHTLQNIQFADVIPYGEEGKKQLQQRLEKSP